MLVKVSAGHMVDIMHKPQRNRKHTNAGDVSTFCGSRQCRILMSPFGVAPYFTTIKIERIL